MTTTRKKSHETTHPTAKAVHETPDHEETAMKTETTESAPALETTSIETKPTTSATAPGDPPPDGTGPVPPAEWQPAAKKGRARAVVPKGAQITHAARTAEEIGSSTTFVEDFGTKAPNPKKLASVVANAAKWRASWTASKRWYAYCSEQRALWETDELAQMAAFAPAFKYSVSRDPSVGEKYPSTAKFIGSPSALARRSAARRKQNEAEERKKAKAAPAPAPPAPATDTTTK